MIRHNWPWKLVAVILALFLWSYVNTQRNPKAVRTISVPIQTMNLAKGYVADITRQEASVQVEGLKALVDTIRQNDIYAWVDLDKVMPSGGPSQKSYRINVRISGIPSEDIDFVVNPKTVDVRVEMIGGKRLPVEVKYLSAPPLGYTFSDPIISPASVSVSGKSENIAKVKKVVLTLSQNTPSSSIDQEFPLVPMDTNGNHVRGVTISPPSVRLELGLIEVPASKKVVISPKLDGTPKFPKTIKKVTINPSSVVLEGRPNVLADISRIETVPIDVDGLDQSITSQVSLAVPNGTTIKGTKVVMVNIEIE